MAHAAPKIIFGTGGVGTWTSETVDGMLDLLKKHNVTALDTAFLYVCCSISISR